MALKLIVGNSGSGKSYQTYQEIIKASLEHLEQKYLIIVPEQFTMQIQRELVKLHPNHGISNIEVLSFQRLAYRIFEEVGTGRLTVLEETGKSLLLRKSAIEQKERLKVLGRNLEKTGYIKEVKSLISELKQYNVSAAGMDTLIEQAEENPQLYYKLQDIQILYQAFQEKLKEKFITSEETLDVLAEVISMSKIIKNSTILLDEFTGFTPIQQKLIRELLKNSRDVLVTVTLDVAEDMWRTRGIHELFYLSKKTIHTLTELAKAVAVEIAEPRVLTNSVGYRFAKAPALRFLETNFLRRKMCSYEKEVAEISIHASKNVVAEVHFAARTIRNLVWKSAYRYQDIAVVTGNMELYGNYIDKVFKEYQIPVFIDTTKQILLNPFLEFIRAALEVAERNYDYKSIFRLLRTGLCGITSEEIDRLENYVLAAGIRGKHGWEMLWEKKTRQIPVEEVLILNKLRVQILENLLPFTKVVKSKKTSIKEKTESLYQFISTHQIQEQLLAYEEQFKVAGELTAAKEYGQIYQIVITLLEKTVELLGTEVLGLKEYTEILEAGFSEARVGMIPPTTDQIVIGDIQRTRLQNVKTLIFLGLNDGLVPKASSKTGLLSELDREKLQASGVELAPSSRENGYIQRFYLYLIMTKPSHRLYLSYSKSSPDSSALRPSYVIGRMRRLFPQINVVDEDVIVQSEIPMLTPENSLAYLLKGLQQMNKEEPSAKWKELYSWYQKNVEWKNRIQALVNAAFYTKNDKGLSKAVAKALYGEVLENSVSRLEQFAGCAFAHFMTYGLSLREREEYTFQAVDLGNVIHRVIEEFSKRLEQSQYTWFDLPKEVRKVWTKECVGLAASEYGGSILKSNARNEYVINRIERIMKRTLWALTKQVQAGNFVPRNYEVSFEAVEGLAAVNITLDENEKMRLRGRIDRIDTCEVDSQVYIKVIDYKSGNTGFDIAAVYHGLQLQLVVYLNAAMEMEQRIAPEKEIIPAGIFYYRTNDPMIDTNGETTAEQVNEEILKSLKLNGLVNESPQVVENMDKQMLKKSNIIPVSYKKDGSPDQYASVASKEQFEVLSSYVNQKIRNLGNRMLSGETSISPYEQKNRTACDYCEYKAICGFDTKVAGMKYRRLKKYETNEVWERIHQEVEK